MPGLQRKQLAARRQGWKDIIDDNDENQQAQMATSKRILKALVAGKSGGTVKLQNLQLSEVQPKTEAVKS